MQQTHVNEQQHGERLDVLIVTLFPRMSRAFVQKLCDQQKILVNGVSERPGRKVRMGELVTLDYDLASLDDIPSIDMPILYEDEDCVVMSKPPGVLTHAQGFMQNEATVASFLRERLDAATTKTEWGERGRAGIVHRLDRATSGVIIGAKKPEALSFLQQQFALRKVNKTYCAIVKGHLKHDEAIIDMPIERNPKAPATFRVGKGGKHAITHYTVLQRNEQATLLEIHPETGRTHQLRVHFSHIGHPIVGDPLYGDGTYGDRLYLHAHKLEITLPNKQRHEFIAPIPQEFAEYMKLAQKG